MPLGFRQSQEIYMPAYLRIVDTTLTKASRSTIIDALTLVNSLHCETRTTLSFLICSVLFLISISKYILRTYCMPATKHFEFCISHI